MKSRQKIFFISVFILSLSLSILLFIFKDFFMGARYLGLFGIFIINLASNASFFVAGPGFLSVIAGGSIYPPILVAFVSSLGSSIGDLLPFVLGSSGRKLAFKKLEKKKWFVVLEKYFRMYGALILFVFALVPNPLFDSIGIIAGAFAFPLWKFFVIVFIGRLIRFFLLASFGARF